ncbi:MAG: hypothetical protein AAGJ93_11150 [Bacteroidota bacterium]
MRILGYLDHPSLKITVFKTDTRLSIKFENGNFEQTYKFRPSEQTNSLREINKLVDETLLEQVTTLFRQMEQHFSASFLRHFPPSDEDEFDEII